MNLLLGGCKKSDTLIMDQVSDFFVTVYAGKVIS